MPDDGKRPPLPQRLLGLWRDLGRLARGHDTSRAALLLRALLVRKKAGFWPREALAAGLLDPRLPDAALGGRIPKRRLTAVQRWLNPRAVACLTGDKAIFYLYCAALGLPTPRLLAVFATPAGFTAAGEPLSGLRAWEGLFDSLPSEFVVKPADGEYGRGIHVFRRSGDAFVDAKGASYSPATLYDWLASGASVRKLVIQERLFAHPDLERLSGTRSLQTLRVVTYVEPGGGVDVCDALLKIIVGDAWVDNFEGGRTGNLFARVRIADGVLGPAVGRDPNGFGLVSHVSHPRTGVPLSGLPLPGFAEALGLVRRAASLFLPLRTIGWDVALTAGGPVLVEGNIEWDPVNAVAAPLPEGYVPPDGIARLLAHLRA